MGVIGTCNFQLAHYILPQSNINPVLFTIQIDIYHTLFASHHHVWPKYIVKQLQIIFYIPYGQQITNTAGKFCVWCHYEFRS